MSVRETVMLVHVLLVYIRYCNWYWEKVLVGAVQLTRILLALDAVVVKLEGTGSREDARGVAVGVGVGVYVGVGVKVGVGVSVGAGAALTASASEKEPVVSRRKVVASIAPSVFVTTVRSNMANGFTPDVGDGMTMRSRSFLSENTADAITSDPGVRQDAASLLGLYDKLNAAVRSIERGAPIIYAVEMYGVEARLRQLGDEASVKDFGVVPIGDAPNWDPPSAELLRDAPSIGLPGASGASEPDGQTLYNRLSAFANRELTPQPTATPTSTPTPTPIP